jgi:hypothetical protein
MDMGTQQAHSMCSMQTPRTLLNQLTDMIATRLPMVMYQIPPSYTEGSNSKQVQLLYAGAKRSSSKQALSQQKALLQE